MKKFNTPIFFVTSVCFSLAFATEKPTTIQVVQADTYEKCALKVFEKSSKVSDVFKLCEAEMNAYLAIYDAKTKEKVKQKVKVETRRALTKKTLPPSSNEG